MLVTVFVPEFGVIEAITPPYRSFQTANDFLVAAGKAPLFEVEYVGLQQYVPANNGEYRVQTNRLLSEVSHTDLLFIPPTFGEINLGIENNKEAFPHFIRLYNEGAHLASLCIGAFLLAETGLLSGKKCSTHWAHLQEFKSKYPDVAVEDGAIITEHGHIFSSGGASSLWNLILYLVEKYADRQIAVMISKYFALDIGRDTQAHFTIFKGQLNHGDSAISRAQEYIEKNFEERLSIDELANLVHLGRRTFERRFNEATNNTPVEYIQRVRMEAAKKYLESSQWNVNEVMRLVGYSDAKAFREVFKKVVGRTPIEYKNTFARVAAEV
jgi:transcriptional regulator GlxA family with amidase domain